MTDTTTARATRGGVAGRVPRRYRKHAGRVLTVSTTVGEPAWARVDARAERAGLALGSWMVLLAADVAAGRPVAGEAVLDGVVAARVRVARLGAAVNAMAARENRGITVEDGELLAVLGSLAVRAGQAVDAVRAAGEVFAGAGAGDGSTPGAGAAAGRRGKDVAGRGRRIRAAMTPAERDLLVGAAGREGLSVGAWLGQLLEDPGACRPLRGEVWGAVFGLRQAARRVGTNLAQIQDARAARGVAVPPGVRDARGQVEGVIRACLDAQAAISGRAGAGGAA